MTQCLFKNNFYIHYHFVDQHRHKSNNKATVFFSHISVKPDLRICPSEDRGWKLRQFSVFPVSCSQVGSLTLRIKTSSPIWTSLYSKGSLLLQAELLWAQNRGRVSSQSCSSSFCLWLHGGGWGVGRWSLRWDWGRAAFNSRQSPRPSLAPVVGHTDLCSLFYLTGAFAGCSQDFLWTMLSLS